MDTPKSGLRMKPSLPPIASLAKQGPATPAPQGWPVWRLGFRPFYLGTAWLACVSVPMWIALYLGYTDGGLQLSPMWWHAHEMLFGFAAGVIVGFLLTAVKAWTGLPTPRGPWLAALFLLWLAARVAALTAPYHWYALLDVLLLPAVAVALLRVLIRAGNKRNMPLIGLLWLMTLANAVFHLSVMGWLEVQAVTALHAQLALIMLVVTVITGRVIPMLTKNVTPGLVIQQSQPFEWSVLGATALALLMWVSSMPAWLVSVVSVVAAILHTVRLWRWHPQVTIKRPILWILHLSYAWMPIGFVLLALTQWGWVNPSLPVHAFGVGLIGGLIIGMVTRTARGHTGRLLRVSKAEVIAYVLVLSAAVMRVLVPAVFPGGYVWALQVAAVLWALSFAIYLVVYTPWLMKTRLDGKDG